MEEDNNFFFFLERECHIEEREEREKLNESKSGTVDTGDLEK